MKNIHLTFLAYFGKVGILVPQGSAGLLRGNEGQAYLLKGASVVYTNQFRGVHVYGRARMGLGAAPRTLENSRDF